MPASPEQHADARRPIEPFTLVDRALIAVLVALSVWCFQAVAHWLQWPREPSHSGSLLASVNPTAGLVAMGVGVLACLALGSLVLGRTRYEAGLFAAACGLAVLASRGGTVGDALRTIGRPGLYQVFLYETVMLLGVIALAWLALSVFGLMGWARRDLTTPANPVNFLMALLIQAVVTALLVLLMARTDGNKQALTAVFLAALLGALCAHQTIPVSTSAPFWAGTLLVGLGGFAWAMARPGRWQIGVPANPLTHVSPLGYASLGTAGALIGYWASLRWHATSEEEEDELLDPAEAPESHLIDEPPVV